MISEVELSEIENNSSWQSWVGKRVRSNSLTGKEFQFCKMKTFWRWIAVMVVQQCLWLYCHWTVSLKMAEIVNIVLCISVQFVITSKKCSIHLFVTVFRAVQPSQLYSVQNIFNTPEWNLESTRSLSPFSFPSKP